MIQQESGYLLDTNYCVYLINGLEKSPQERSAPERVVIDTLESLPDLPLYFSEVTLGELYYGVARSSRKIQNQKKLLLLKQLLYPLPVTEEVWKLFGETLADLHHQGQPIADRDLLIACTAKIYALTLVTNDRDFENLPESFKRINWIQS
jgi:predicted nucleic acid-binding protein